MDASKITQLIGLNRNSVNLYLRAIRERIAEFCETQSPFSGEIEADEIFFGGVLKGKRGQGASSKTIIFGILKRNGKVYTCLLYTSPSPRDRQKSRMPSSA